VIGGGAGGGGRVTGAAEGLRLLDDGARRQAPDDPPAGAAADADAAASSLPRRFAAGEPAALARVVAEYQSRVERLASRLLGWRGDVDDVVQDVFLAAMKHAGRLRGSAGLWPWLAAITVNACRSHRRREWVRLTFLRRQLEPPASGAASPAADASAEGREALDEMRKALGRLAAGDREVLVLHYLEGMTPAGLAEVLSCSANAVQVRLHRARRRLAAELGVPPEEGRK
jgi:RNA polymerase sigma factor (sigma-70 family)